MHTFDLQDDPSQDIYYAYNNIIINGVGTRGFEHHQSYILEKLMPDSMYEAQIQARNHYGWSAVSDKFQFYTRAYGEFEPDLTLIRVNSGNTASLKST